MIKKLFLSVMLALAAFSSTLNAATTTYLGITYLTNAQSQPDVPINAAWNILDATASGIANSLSLTITADTTLTNAQASKGVFLLGGTPASAFNFNLPAVALGPKIIKNSTGRTATVKPAGGSGFTLATGSTAIVFSNGTVAENADTTGSFILNSGTNFGITAPGAMTSGSTYTIGATTDNLRFNGLGLGVAAPTTAGQIASTLGANNVTALTIKRNTDTSPTGKFFDFQNAAGASLAYVDITGATYLNGSLWVGFTTDQDTSKLQINGGGYFNGTLSVLHYKGNGSAPSASPGTGAGTGGACTLAGTDTSGTITVATGTIPAGAATVCTVTFSNAFAAAPVVVFSANNSNAAGLSGLTAVYMTSSTTTITITSDATGLGASTTYKWTYISIQ